jgi:cyclic pyranopterin phosphate synthase
MAPFDASAASQSLTDPFGRTVDYLRVSVTDRCDLRCTYCMAERQTFLPKAQVLSLEELDRLCTVFVGLGVRRLRLTGGEPLVRRGFMGLVAGLSRHLEAGRLDELLITTNATRLAEHAAELARCGVRRVNVSLDTLDPQRFARITRGGELARVMAGIEAARSCGLKLKINTVALRSDNAAELPAMIQWAHRQGMDISLIETMPMGEVEADRTAQFLPLSEVRRELESFWTLTDLPDRTPGPSRYVRVEETGGRLGFITPLTHNFCEACNRVRLTCTGTLYMCLGQEDSADLRQAIRDHPADDAPVVAAVRDAIARKPKGHDFRIAPQAAPAVRRVMAMTGG